MTTARLTLFAVALLAGLAAVSVPAEPPTEPTNATLIIRLGDREYAVREAAEAALVARGEPALADLREAADASGSMEVRWRARRAWNRIALGTAGVSKTTGMKLALALSGEFEMGSPPREQGRQADEQSHAVRMTGRFLIGTCEVTQGEYAAATDARPSWFAPTGGGKAKAEGLKADALPVENVTWFDAVAFCNALSKKDGYKAYYELADVARTDGAITAATVKTLGGNGYRLPTEAEWEYACRAGTATAFHFGRSSQGGEGNFKTIIYGGYGGNEERLSKGRTTDVTGYAPNRWGLHQTHGNVAEWCDDWYERAYNLKAEAEHDPPGPADGTHKVVRGGSWLVTHTSCRAASRLALKPNERNNATGFRVARTP